MPKPNEVIDRNSSISFLQQRLNYADSRRGNYISFIENVPCWPRTSLDFPVANQDSFLRYANCQGEAELLEAIIQREQKVYNIQLEKDNLLITNGAFQAISLIARTIRRSGKILCPLPTLSSIISILTTSRQDLFFLPLAPEKSFTERIKNSCLNNNIHVVYLNIPHNPSGYVMSASELKYLVRFLHKNGISLIIDMVYDSYIFDSTVFESPLSLIEDWSHIYLVNSMSKNYGAPGLRVGWIESTKSNIEELTSHFESECISVCTASQEQACQLLNHGNDKLVEHVYKNWFFVGKELNSISESGFEHPAGGTQFFIELPVKDVEVFADYMLINHNLILVTTGNFFGVDTQSVRIPLGQDQAIIETGLKILTAGLNDWLENNKTISEQA